MTIHKTGAFPSEAPKRTVDSFDALNLSRPILRAIAEEGYQAPTPIQAEAIPHVLLGRDLMGCAQTGTGKTAAFALPILQRLAAAPADSPRPIRALVLTPTRELASQVHEAFRAYGRHTRLRTTVVYGGVSQGSQVRALQRGVDILVATPGRLLDLMGQGCLSLHAVEAFVLDEADRMFDMGFIHDVRRVVAAIPAHRQTLLFSATMPPAIRTLADSILRDPIAVRVAPESARADHIEQSVYFVDRDRKPDLLREILGDDSVTRALVFTRTKHGADRLVRQLLRTGFQAEAIHGNKNQNARERALARFRTRETPVLVATDLAARGLDIDEVSHVVNFDLPDEPETYVHRIGRTARAGASGIALSFCAFEERASLHAIERLIREPLPVIRNGVREVPAAPALPLGPAPGTRPVVVYRTRRRRR